MVSAMESLKDQIRGFNEWANTSADKRNADWPTDYPQLDNIIKATEQVMRWYSEQEDKSITREDASAIAFVWQISEESEPMKHIARSMGNRIGWLLRSVYSVGHVDTRWQIVSVSADIASLGTEFLLMAIQDSDSYVRRRAWYALFDASPQIAAREAEKMLTIEDDKEIQKALQLIVDAVPRQ